MLQSNSITSRRPVKPVPFRQIKGVRVYQGAQRRTMVGNMAAICRMLELDEPSTKLID
ncbi:MULTISPECIES: hypothetical protein [unclassified Cupriavidus]|jgi:hypothetical protein|uniref:hypothetical protein n=1 Tax=unclassified Cupriavidus TaxID=2640874 RepID=UPI001C004C95|nr:MULTISPECIES: hypothetical protein [unclassified Cupriavidus]MCA3182740.1 hypothetical protein [Cupriavidus sp.]MCA3189802.1 hypothetical protein [Cupriavidus sp.]MCA3196396.1 hypothetical protein [Cupriavidus sp.]MCA3202141.1 hypothetical protein [Cupriavidus sp.]QWE93280.1 hypothetical protein KLP38_09510 [Cupriavidus sp. EM10]